MNALINLVPGKRDALIRKMKRERNERMRAELPVLNREEIIRYRLPRHEALMRAIDQEGYSNTAEYMKQLIDYQEYVRNFYGPDTTVWIKPRLMNQMDILHHLRNGLTAAEKAHLAGNTAHELREILKLAVEYAFGEENWWWLGHQLLDQAILISQDFRKDAGMYHSIARYALGKFLLEQFLDMESALEHLNIARSMSVGNPWTAKGIFKTQQATVFTEVSILLFQVLLKQARKSMNRDTHLAIRLCQRARKTARDGCHYAGETEAYIVLGECEQLIRDTQSAITSFQKALSIQNFHEDPKWKCEALSHLAIAYLKHGLSSSALQVLQDLKNYAMKKEMIFYVALSYKYLGQYYLREGTPKNATPLLKIALKLFNEGNYVHEAQSTRNYAAISIGIELTNLFIQLIVACDEKNPDYEEQMNKLIDWKDSRVVFWKDLHGDISFSRLDDNDDEVENSVPSATELTNIGTTSGEMVLSVQSLVGSNASVRMSVSQESGDSGSILPKEFTDEGGNEENFIETEVGYEKVSMENTEDEKQKIITLHVSEKFEEGNDE